MRGACDLVMPDVARIGGVTGWMQAAGDRRGATACPMSSHLMPELSAHLLAASPTCHWLEYVDWAGCPAEGAAADRGRRCRRVRAPRPRNRMGRSGRFALPTGLKRVPELGISPGDATRTRSWERFRP